MQKNENQKKFPIGQILVDHGYITKEELAEALQVQKESKDYSPLGQICVDLKYISGIDLTKILRKYRKHMYLGELLVNMGIINGEQLELVLQKQKEEKKPIGELLIELGLITENQLTKSLSMQLGIPIINPDIHLIDQGLAKRCSEAFLRRQEAVPAFEKDGVVTLIMANPLSENIVNDFKKYFDAQIESAIASRSAISQLLDALFNKIEYGQKDMDSLADKDLIIGNESYAKDSRDDAIKIVNYIISSAIAEDASDIHIEPQSYNLRIRYRIDGVLQHKTDLPKQLAASIVSRIKVMAGMDIAEHRKHQDGRIEARILDNDIDLRVSVYAAVYGENIVIRILRRQTILIDMNKLGFSPLNMKRFKKILVSPTGIILVCGPTGSGKTTTLYASINHLNNMDNKIITVEDPVEYTMDGVIQGQLNTKIGMRYSDFIASMMRQDPDVIMVGEIRDNIAAEATIQAALTGHKAFSTFHTEDSVGALLRLMDMGIETFLISSTVVSVIAQRLIRKVCERCKEPYEPDPSIFASFGIKNVDVSKYTFLQGKGCDFCHNTGFKGRIGIHEILIVNDDIRDAILTRKVSSDIRRIAKTSAGMVTMREDGFYKAAQGITTLEEILRVVFYSDADMESFQDADFVIRMIDGEEIPLPPSEIAAAQTVQPHQPFQPTQPTQPPQESQTFQPTQTPQPHQPFQPTQPTQPPQTPQGPNEVTSPPIRPQGLDKQEFSQNTMSSDTLPRKNTVKYQGERYRIRFEADTITLEQDRIQDFFQKYLSLKNEFGGKISEDLLEDFIDFIVYYTTLSQKKYGAVFVEFYLKVIEEYPKIFLQFQVYNQHEPSAYSQRMRGQRLMEFLT